MARAPFQVLIFPYRINSQDKIEYAIFFRLTEEYGDFWQAIAGGGEDDETPLEAARRELHEESGMLTDSEFIELESMVMLPANAATGKLMWGEGVLVIPEYAFGVYADQQEIVLSHEHVQYRWENYETARQLLRWDSNKNALWELNYRLTRVSN